MRDTRRKNTALSISSFELVRVWELGADAVQPPPRARASSSEASALIPAAFGCVLEGARTLLDKVFVVRLEHANANELVVLRTIIMKAQ